jgi:hypothetical protein
MAQRLNEELKADPHGTLLKIQTFLALIEDQIRIFGDTVKLAQLGKLNPDQVPYTQLERMATFIWEMERDHHLESPINVPSDLFTMPMSYLYNMEEERLEFIIHVPMYRPGQLLDMYEYQPFPMTLGADRNRVAVPRPGSHNILAYNAQNEFQTMTNTDLQNCFVLRRVHYCPNRQVLKTDWSKTCLSALFKMNQVAATRYCDFEIQPADERVLKLDHNNYLIYTNRQMVAEKHCGTKHESISIKEGSHVNVGPGCKIKLDQHQIYGENSFVQTFDNPKVFVWDWDAQRVLRNHSGPQLRQALEALTHEAGQTFFETEDILQQIEMQQLKLQVDILEQEKLDVKLNNPLSMFHWIGIGVSALVTFVLITLFAMCLRQYITYRLRSHHTPTTPSAPALEMAHNPPAPNRALFRIF